MKQHLLHILFVAAMITVSVSDAEVVTLAEDGSWGYNGPYAVTAHGRLYWTYLDTKGMVWAASYDPDSGDIARGEVWPTSADLHQASPVLVRPDGHIQIFVNKGHVYTDTRIFWRVSERPGDVTSFGPLQESADVGVDQGRQFYPMVHRATGHVYMILNVRNPDGRRIALWHSTDGGDTFDEFHVLYGLGDGLPSNRSYTRAFIEGDQIHLIAHRLGWHAPLDGHRIGRVEGIFYTRYDINDRAFFHADGRRAFSLDETPVTDTALFDTIWNWERDGEMVHRAVWADLVARDGHPFVAFVEQRAAAPRTDDTTTLHTAYWATPDASMQWQSHRVTTLAPGWDNRPRRKNYGIAIDPDDPSTVYVSKSTQPEQGLSQVHRMHTTDDGRTWTPVAALSQEGRTSTVIVPHRLDDTPRVLEALWLEGRMDGWTQYGTRVMGFKQP